MKFAATEGNDEIQKSEAQGVAVTVNSDLFRRN